MNKSLHTCDVNMNIHDIAEIQCPPIRIWEDINVNSSVNIVGTVVNVTCAANKSIFLTNHEWTVIYCNSSGDWFPLTPRCTGMIALIMTTC